MRIDERIGLVPDGNYEATLAAAFVIEQVWTEVELIVTGGPYDGVRLSCDVRTDNLLECLILESTSELPQLYGKVYEIEVTTFARPGLHPVYDCSILSYVEPFELPSPIKAKSSSSWQEVGF